MKVFNIDLTKIDSKYKQVKEIRIVPLADIHIGNPLLDEKLLKQTIEYIKDNDNVFTILNGDLMNTAIKSSISDIYEETMTPMQQIEELVNLLAPIKEKILVATSGNHERRITRETSIDITHIAMKELAIGERYTNGAYYLYLYFGEKERGRKAPMVYTIFGYHGSGNGRKLGGKINRLVEMSEICVADIFLMSHVHTPIGTKKVMFVPDYGNKTLTRREMLYAVSNSFLNYGGYASQHGYSPVSTSRIEIILNGNKRESKLLM
jgi:hypothetical protein